MQSSKLIGCHFVKTEVNNQLKQYQNFIKSSSDNQAVIQESINRIQLFQPYYNEIQILSYKMTNKKFQMSLLTFTILLSSVIVIIIINIQDSIQNSFQRLIIYYGLTLIMMIYLIKRLVIWIQQLMSQHHQNIYNLRDKKNQHYQLQNRKPLKKNLEGFEAIVQKASIQQQEKKTALTSKRSSLSKLYHPVQSYQRFSTQVSNFDDINTSIVSYKELGSSEPIISEIKRMINNKSSQNLNSLTKNNIILPAGINKDNRITSNAIKQMTLYLNSILQTKIYYNLQKKIKQLNNQISSFFQLQLSLYQKQYHLTIEEIREIIKIYKQQKILPLKYMKKIQQRYILHQLPTFIYNITQLLSQIPDFQSISLLQMSLYSLCLSYELDKQIFKIVNPNIPYLCWIEKGTFKMITIDKEKISENVDSFQKKEGKNDKNEHIFMNNNNDVFTYLKCPQFRTSKVEIIIMLAIKEVRLKYEKKKIVNLVKRCFN